MATVNLTTSGAIASAFPAPLYLRPVGVLSRKVDFAEATTQKGSALAAGDILRIVEIPDGVILLGASAFIETVATSGGLDATLDIGWSGSQDLIVDGVSVFTSGFCAAGTNGAVASYTGGIRLNRANGQWVDMELKTMSGTLVDGKVRIDLILADVGSAGAQGTDFADV